MPRGVLRTLHPEDYRELDKERKEKAALERKKPRRKPGTKKGQNPLALSEVEHKERISFWLDGMRKGKPMDVLTDEFCKRFKPDSKDPLSIAKKSKAAALKWLEENLVSNAGRFRAAQMDRLEDLYQRCLERENYKVALSIIDTMNKLMGVYKAEAVLVQPITQFNFGDESIAAMPAVPTLVVPDGYIAPPDQDDEEQEFQEAEDAVEYLADNEEDEVQEF